MGKVCGRFTPLRSRNSLSACRCSDRFLVNIQPEQRQALSEFLERNGVKRPQTFPMVRARLVAINGKQVSAEDYSDERARRQIEREFNVTYLPALPPENKVSEGAWFGPDDLERGAISVEHWIAERFGIRTGDRLDFVSAGQGFSAPVASIRKLDWDSMRPNFFFITTPRLLAGFPASYIASFHAPPGDALLTLRLSRAVPNVTVIDWTLATRVFQLVFVWNGWIWLAGPALGLACIVLNAWAGARAALSRPPMAALREVV